MSFGINGPDRRPAIEKPQNLFNNGGGGSTGYFQQGRKKKEEEDIQDILELSTESEEIAFEKFSEYEGTVNSIGTKIKNFWFKMHSLKEITNGENE